MKSCHNLGVDILRLHLSTILSIALVNNFISIHLDSPFDLYFNANIEMKLITNSESHFKTMQHLLLLGYLFNTLYYVSYQKMLASFKSVLIKMFHCLRSQTWYGMYIFLNESFNFGFLPIVYVSETE